MTGSTLDDLMWSLLLAWWASCFGPFLRDGDRYRVFLLSVSGLLLFASMITRLSLYKIGYESPISPWGRLWTGRWIIPRHDVVFLGPALIPIAPGLAFGACLAGGVPWRVAGPIALGVMLSAARATPPSLRRGRLTGRHRMTPGRPKDAG